MSLYTKQIKVEYKWIGKEMTKEIASNDVGCIWNKAEFNLTANKQADVV